MTGEQPASRVVVSYPQDLSEWGREKLDSTSFRSYLRKAHPTAQVGDEWAEFVGVGCCGDTLDIPLRVEAIDGGVELTKNTVIEFSVRQACDIDGGWAVQSAASPES